MTESAQMMLLTGVADHEYGLGWRQKPKKSKRQDGRDDPSRARETERVGDHRQLGDRP